MKTTNRTFSPPGNRNHASMKSASAHHDEQAHGNNAMTATKTGDDGTTDGGRLTDGGK